MTTMNRFATDVKLIRKSRKEKKMNVLEIKGNVNTALCYAKVVEDEAIEQIKRMCDYAMSEGSKIRIMPDVHAGKGCTIGTTMTIIDKAVPNVVGVDIGCGMYTVNLGKDEIDFEKVDEAAHFIPSGHEVWEGRQEKFDLTDLRCYRELRDTKRLVRSLGINLEVEIILLKLTKLQMERNISSFILGAEILENRWQIYIRGLQLI